MFLPILPKEQPQLLAELESDPFDEHAVSNATCELNHMFRMILAPVTAVLFTLRHCRFGHQDGPRIDGLSDGGRNSATSAQSATMTVLMGHVVPVEKVTAPAPVPVVALPMAKPKDSKKVTAGRARAAVRRARQENLLARGNQLTIRGCC